MSDEIDLQFEPVRRSLYSPDELMSGFERDDPSSLAHTTDFRIFQNFVGSGRDETRNPYLRMMRSLHDNSIAFEAEKFLRGKRVAAVMGGHAMLRDAPAYREVAVMSRALTREGILMCSGGGPGAMEATHLGALLAPSPDADLDPALATLAEQPRMPKGIENIVSPNGEFEPALVRSAHAWLEPALRIVRGIGDRGQSLGIPTWHYGHEPTSVLATHIGKYFQNSIREDGLLALANQGVIFAPGMAGTIQEIFQDAAQNHYQAFGQFSPMVLFGTDYWTQRFPVAPVLRELFGRERYDERVLVTDDPDAAVRFIADFEPEPSRISGPRSAVRHSPDDE